MMLFCNKNLAVHASNIPFEQWWGDASFRSLTCQPSFSFSCRRCRCQAGPYPSFSLTCCPFSTSSCCHPCFRNRNPSFCAFLRLRLAGIRTIVILLVLLVWKLGLLLFLPRPRGIARSVRFCGWFCTHLAHTVIGLCLMKSTRKACSDGFGELVHRLWLAGPLLDRSMLLVGVGNDLATRLEVLRHGQEFSCSNQRTPRAWMHNLREYPIHLTASLMCLHLATRWLPFSRLSQASCAMHHCWNPTATSDPWTLGEILPTTSQIRSCSCHWDWCT